MNLRKVQRHTPAALLLWVCLLPACATDTRGVPSRFDWGGDKTATEAVFERAVGRPRRSAARLGSWLSPSRRRLYILEIAEHTDVPVSGDVATLVILRSDETLTAYELPLGECGCLGERSITVQCVRQCLSKQSMVESEGPVLRVASGDQILAVSEGGQYYVQAVGEAVHLCSVASVDPIADLDARLSWNSRYGSWVWRASETEGQVGQAPVRSLERPTMFETARYVHLWIDHPSRKYGERQRADLWSYSKKSGEWEYRRVDDPHTSFIWYPLNCDYETDEFVCISTNDFPLPTWTFWYSFYEGMFSEATQERIDEATWSLARIPEDITRLRVTPAVELTGTQEGDFDRSGLPVN